MAYYTTGPDFQGILGAQKAGGVFKKANEDYRGLDYFEDRYGQGIGDDGYLTGGITDMMFYDTDDDGIDDRYQSGPGQPRADSAPDGGPIFGGGAGGGGGGDGGGENSPFGNNPFDSYDMNPDGTITQYDASTGETNTYEYNDPNASFPQRFFGTAMTAADMVPTAGKFISSLASSAYDKFIDPADQAIAEMLGLTGSYDEQQQAAEDFTQSNISKKEALASDLEAQNANMLSQLKDMAIDDVYSPGFASLSSLADISDYTVAELEDQALGINMNMTKQYNDAIAKAEAQAAAAAAKAEQDKINAAVASGKYVGTGYDPVTGNYSGLLTNTNSNSGTSVTSNVQTGAYSPAALSGAIQNENFNNMMNNRRDRDSRRDPDGNAGGAGGNATGGNAKESDPGDSGCFEPNTLIAMQDGSEKKIKDVQLGDITKGGKVTGVLQFEPIDDIHEYKGVIVAGSHFVKEGNEFIMVQDSPESVKIDKIPVVYSLDTTNRRIFINDIEFADYNGDGIAKKFLNNAGMDLSGFDKEVLRQVEHRLI